MQQKRREWWGLQMACGPWCWEGEHSLKLRICSALSGMDDNKPNSNVSVNFWNCLYYTELQFIVKKFFTNGVNHVFHTPVFLE
jgi:hypothetical protein